jgi:hypothetical protein
MFLSRSREIYNPLYIYTVVGATVSNFLGNYYCHAEADRASARSMLLAVERERLFERAGCLKKGQLLDTPQGQSDSWIFRAKNVTYQKPPFWVR